jgi:OPA family glycerol-3-phosphate transporter-like MFS transporter
LFLGALAVLLLIIVRSTPKKAGYTVDWTSPAEVAKPRIDIKDYFRCLVNSKFVMACLCMLCCNFVRWGLVNWIVKILAEPLDKGGYGMTLMLAGAVGSSIHWGAAFLSLTTGWLSDKMFKGQRWPVICTGFILSSICLFVLSMGPKLLGWPAGVAIVVALLFIAGGVNQAIMAPMCCLPGDIFGAQLGGTGNGIMNGVGYVGAIFAGTILGAVMDVSGFMMGIIVLAIMSAVGAGLSFAIRR